MGLLYLAAGLLRNGHTVKVIDANAMGLPDKNVADEICAINPDLVGVSLFSEIFFQSYALIKHIKSAYPPAKIVAGGRMQLPARKG